MNCKACQTEIEEVGKDSRLSDESQAHLATCRSCRDFQRERLALKQLLGDLEPITAPPDFAFRLQSHLAAVKSAEKHRLNWSSFAPGIPAIALAALFVVLLAAAVSYRHLPFRPIQTAPPAELATATPRRVDAPEQATTSGRLNIATEQNPPAMVNEVKKRKVNSGALSKVRSRATEPREVNVKREAWPAAAPNTSVAANEFSVGAARVKTPSGEFNPTGALSLPATVPVRVSTQQMKVLLDDGRGTKRMIALEPVTFGSQEIIERSGAKPVKVSGTRGIW